MPRDSARVGGNLHRPRRFNHRGSDSPTPDDLPLYGLSRGGDGALCGPVCFVAVEHEIRPDSPTANAMTTTSGTHTTGRFNFSALLTRAFIGRCHSRPGTPVN